MKLKPAKLILEPKAYRKIFWLLFAQGVLIGLMVAAKQDGYTEAVSPALFIVINVVLIPAMARRLFTDKDNGIDRTN